MKHSLAIVALVTLLAGCGTPAKLRPREGMGDVPIARGMNQRATPTELMTPSTQARPDRQADLLSRSEERQDDPFDLPPGRDNGQPASAAPVPASSASAAPETGSR